MVRPVADHRFRPAAEHVETPKRVGPAKAVAPRADVDALGTDRPIAPTATEARAQLVDGPRAVSRDNSFATWAAASVAAAVRAVQKDGLLLRSMPTRLQADREVVAAAVQQNPGAMRFAAPSLRADRQLFMELIWRQPEALAFMPEAWKEDREIALSFIQVKPAVARFFSPKLWTDPLLVRAALGQLGNGRGAENDWEMRRREPEKWLKQQRDAAAFLEHASPKLLDDADFVLPIVRSNGLALRYASARLRADPDVVKAAVEENGLALEFADRPLQGDLAMATLAVGRAGDALIFVPRTTPLGRDTYLAALRTATDTQVFASLPAEFTTDPELALQAVTANGLWLARRPDKAADRDWALAAVRSRWEALRLVGPALRADREVVLACGGRGDMPTRLQAKWLDLVEGSARQDPEVLRRAVWAGRDNLKALPATVTKGKALALQLLANGVPIFAGLDKSLRADPEVVRAAIRVQPAEVMAYLPEDTPGYRDLAQEVLAASPESIEHASAAIQRDPVLVGALVRRQPPVLGLVARELFADKEFLAGLDLTGQPQLLRYLPLDAPGYRELARQAVTQDPTLLRWLPAEMVTDALLAALVANQPQAVQYAPASFRDRPEVMRPLLARQPDLLQFAGPRVRGDRAIVLELVGIQGRVLAFAAPSLQSDRTVVAAAVAQDPTALRYAHPRLRGEREWVLAAIQRDPTLMLLLPLELRRDPEIRALLLKQGAWNTFQYLDTSSLNEVQALELLDQAPQLYEQLPQRLSSLPDVARAALAKNGWLLNRAPLAVRKNLDLVRFAVKQNPGAFQFADLTLRSDPAFVREVLEVDPQQYVNAAGAAKRDVGLLRAVMARTPQLFREADPILRGDLELARVAVRADGNLLQAVAPPASAAREVVETAVAQSGQALQHASAAWRDDEQVALAAVRQSGTALQYASLATRNDPRVVLAAAAQDGLALQYASAALQARPEIVDAAMQQNPAALRFASPALRSDLARARRCLAAAPDLLGELPQLRSDLPTVLNTVALSPTALQFADVGLRDREEIVREAILRDGNALQWASQRLQNDRELALDALRAGPQVFQFVSAELKKTKAFALDAMAICPEGLASLAAFVDDKDVVLNAVYTDGSSLQQASARLRGDKDVVLAAVMQNPDAIDQALPPAANDKEVLVAANLGGRAPRLKGTYSAEVSAPGGASREAAAPAQSDDVEIALAAVYAHAEAYAQLPSALRSDRRVMLAAVSRYEAVYAQLPDELKKDPEVLRAALEVNGALLAQVSPEERANIATVEPAVANQPLALQFASAALQAKRALVRFAVERDGDAIEFAALSLRNDPTVAELAINNKLSAFAHLAALGHDRSFALEMVKRNVEVSQYLPDDMRRDPDFMLEAVKRNGRALHWALPPAAQDPEVVRAAVKQDGRAYADAGALQSDRELALTAMREGGDLRQVPAALQSDKAIQLVAVRKTPAASPLLVPPEQLDADILVAAIQADPEALALLGDGAGQRLSAVWLGMSAAARRPLALAAVQKNGMLLQYVGPDLAQDRDVVMAAVKSRGEALRLAGEASRSDRDIVLAAVRHNRGNIDYAMGPEGPGAGAGAPENVLGYASAALQADREVVLAAVRANAGNLACAAPGLRGDRRVVEAAVAQDGNALSWVNDFALLDDKAIALAALKTCGRIYERLSARLKADRDIVLAAVESGTEASFGGYGPGASRNTVLGRVPWALRHDREVVLTSVEANEESYAAAPMDLRLDLGVASAVATNGWHQFAGQGPGWEAHGPVTVASGLLSSIPAPLRRDAHSMRELVSHDRVALSAASWSVLADEAFQADVVRDNPLLFRTLSRTRDDHFLRFSTPLDLERLAQQHPELHAQAKALDRQLVALNIDYTSRLGTGAMLRNVVGNRLALEAGRSPGQRPKALVVFSSADHNGALHSPRIEKLARAYDVLYYDVATEDDLIGVLKASAEHRRADLFLLAGHGNGWAMRLGDTTFEDFEDEEKFVLDLTDRQQMLAAGIAKAVAPGGRMMAISCSNARGRGARNNLVNMYSSMLPDARVYAAVFPTNASLQLTNDGLFLKPRYVGGTRTGYEIAPLSERTPQAPLAR